MCPNPILPNSGAVPIRPNPLLRQVVAGLRIDRVENQPSERGPIVRCQLSGTPCRYERAAHLDAINVAHGVMRDALAQLSAGKAAALSRTLALMGPSTPQNLGAVLLTHLTAIGAIRAGVAALQTTAEGEPIEGRALLLKQLDDAIVNVGIKAGKCTMAEPDAVYDVNHSSSKEVCKAVASGKKMMLDCAVKMGAPELLAGVAQAVLPRSMQESLADRLPTVLNEARRSNSSPDIYNVLAANAATFVDEVLNVQLDAGDAENLQASVIEVLKIPQYVLDRQRGSAGDPPAEPQATRPREDVRHDDMPQWMRDRGGFINYNPVRVDSGIKDVLNRLGALDLSDVRNVDYERGRELGRMEQKYADLLAKFEAMEARLRDFANPNPNPNPNPNSNSNSNPDPNPNPSRPDGRGLLSEAPHQDLNNDFDETDSSSRLPPDNGQRQPPEPTIDLSLLTAQMNRQTDPGDELTQTIDLPPNPENEGARDNGGSGDGDDDPMVIPLLDDVVLTGANNPLQTRPHDRNGDGDDNGARDGDGFDWDSNFDAMSIFSGPFDPGFDRAPSGQDPNIPPVTDLEPRQPPATNEASGEIPQDEWEWMSRQYGAAFKPWLAREHVKMMLRGEPRERLDPSRPPSQPARTAAASVVVETNEAPPPPPPPPSSSSHIPVTSPTSAMPPTAFGLNPVNLNLPQARLNGSGSSANGRGELPQSRIVSRSRNSTSEGGGGSTWLGTVHHLNRISSFRNAQPLSGSRSPNGVPPVSVPVDTRDTPYQEATTTPNLVIDRLTEGAPEGLEARDSAYNAGSPLGTLESSSPPNSSFGAPPPPNRRASNLYRSSAQALFAGNPSSFTETLGRAVTRTIVSP